MSKKVVIFALLQSITIALAAILMDGDTNGLGARPALGWNSWNKFGCEISQDTILDAARSLVSSGLNKFGYEYVIIDDCWHADSRDPKTSEPLAHPVRFSKGIKYIADEVHNLGLKFGIYSSAGVRTCAGRFGSLGYEEIDAKTYASWGVDYLKYDNCNDQNQHGTPELSFNRYNKMFKALNETDRPIVYAICNWGQDGPWDWAPAIAESWRISGDIWDNFAAKDNNCPCDSMLNCTYSGFHCSVTKIINFAAPLAEKGGRGHWNDLDMLEIGNGGQSFDEYVTHFSLWAIVKSPLILGHDLTKMNNDTFKIITNADVIALNQDSLGKPARRIWTRNVDGGSVQFWAGPLASGDTVVAILNLSPNNVTVNVTLAEAFDSNSTQPPLYDHRDLWEAEGPRSPWDPLKPQEFVLRTHQTKLLVLKASNATGDHGV